MASGRLVPAASRSPGYRPGSKKQQDGSRRAWYSPSMKKWLSQRYLDLLGSIYIYNEHRGYTALDRVLEAVRAKHPEATELITAVEKHRADERKHYTMFKRWFELRGTMPIEVDRAFGHIDRFIEITFGTTIDSLDTDAIIASDNLFERLCRVISLTEKRGLKQVEILLEHPIVKQDKALHRIFQVVHLDEPEHFKPYDRWLAANSRRKPNAWELWIDRMIHSELLFIKLPLLFLWLGAPRRTEWNDYGESHSTPVPAPTVPARP